MQRKYSPEQLAYIAAKAAHEVAYQKYLNLITDLPNDWDTDEELEKIVNAQMVAEKESGLDKARKALREAENNLLKWAHETIKTHPRYRKNAADMEMLFRKARMHLGIYKKLIDTCMRFDPAA